MGLDPLGTPLAIDPGPGGEFVGLAVGAGVGDAILFFGCPCFPPDGAVVGPDVATELRICFGGAVRTPGDRDGDLGA